MLTKVIKENKYLLFIILSALILRLLGINHGFPFLYHPDEPTVVREAMALKSHGLNPGHFDWPHLQIYLSFVIFGIFYIFRPIFGLADFLYPDPVIFYLLGRLITALMGVVTILFVYLVGSNLFSKKLGLISALFLSINVLHISESHVATVDVPMTLWLTISLFFTTRLFSKGRTIDYILAGLFAGLSTSTKYNGGLVIIAIIAAHFVRTIKIVKPGTIKDIRQTISSLNSLFADFKRLLLSGIFALFGFFIGTPFALFDYKTFLSTEGPEGAFWQFYHVGDRGIRVGILERYSLLVKEILFTSQGLLITLLAFLGMYILLKKRAKEALLLIPFPLVYFIYVGTFSYSPPHFFIPILPFLSILAAVGFVSVYTYLKKFFLLEGFRAKNLFIILVILSSFAPMYTSAKADYILTQKDTRTQAREWLRDNFESGTVFGVSGDYDPDLDNTGFDTIPLREILNGKDLSGAIYPYFHEKNINYAILGGFDLDKQLKEINWDPEKPNFTHYVLAKGGLIKRFAPVMRPGPVVLIYQIDYEWEVTNGKGLKKEE